MKEFKEIEKEWNELLKQAEELINKYKKEVK